MKQKVPTHTAEARKPAETKYNDVPFAILFLLHVAFIAFIAFTSGMDELNGKLKDSGSTYKVDPASSEDASNSVNVGTTAVGGIVATLIAAMIVSSLFMKLATILAEDLIHVTMKFTIGLMLVLALIFMATGVIFAAIIYLVFAAIFVCYYRAVQDRIPFAGANLSIACTVVKRFPQLVMAAFATLVLNFLWMALWAVAMLGVAAPGQERSIIVNSGSFDSSLCVDVANGNAFPWKEESDISCPIYEGTGEKNDQPPGCCFCQSGDNTGYDLESSCSSGIGMDSLTYFGMLISFYWGGQVLQNIMHCTTAGTVASWWFTSDMGMSPVFDSFSRAMTWSFGR